MDVVGPDQETRTGARGNLIQLPAGQPGAYTPASQTNPIAAQTGGGGGAAPVGNPLTAQAGATPMAPPSAPIIPGNNNSGQQPAPVTGSRGTPGGETQTGGQNVRPLTVQTKLAPEEQRVAKK